MVAVVVGAAGGLFKETEGAPVSPEVATAVRSGVDSSVPSAVGTKVGSTRLLVPTGVGVEAGQLLVVALTMIVLAGLKRAPDLVENRALTTTTYAIGATGSFWLIERIIG